VNTTSLSGASLRIQDYELRYYLSGQTAGPNFILVPGIGVSHRYFVPLAKELSKLGRVYMLDMPGFGKTAKPDESLSISKYAEILNIFIQTQNIEKPVLIGHSMGCQIVTELLVQWPLLSSRLVLIGPTVNPAERKGPIQALRLFQDGFFEPIRLNCIVTSDYFRCGLRWYLKVLPQMLGDHIEERAADIRVQTVIIRGENDPIVPLVWVKRLAVLIPDSSVHEMPKSGHVCMYNHPKIIAAVCADGVKG
jgi:pimeloyl-ACP methyl ester carboxylesterase